MLLDRAFHWLPAVCGLREIYCVYRAGMLFEARIGRTRWNRWRWACCTRRAKPWHGFQRSCAGCARGGPSRCCTAARLYRGEPVAEIPAIQRECMTLEQCFDDLARRGIVVPSGQAKEPLRVLERRPGALRRFVGDGNA